MGTSEFDSITSLRRRPEFEERLAEAVAGDQGPVSLAFLDLDRFLEVNEKHGREAGDEVLCVLASLLTENFGTDAVYRIGGDELAVVLAGTEKERAFLSLEQLRATFAEIQALGHIDPHPTISAGVATYPDDGGTKQELVRKADDALYRGKSSGRNRITLAREEKKVPKTTHFTQGQLDRLSALSEKEGVGEAELLREALDDLLKKYSS